MIGYENFTREEHWGQVLLATRKQKAGTNKKKRQIFYKITFLADAWWIE